MLKNICGGPLLCKNICNCMKILNKISHGWFPMNNLKFSEQLFCRTAANNYNTSNINVPLIQKPIIWFWLQNNWQVPLDSFSVHHEITRKTTFSSNCCKIQAHSEHSQTIKMDKHFRANCILHPWLGSQQKIPIRNGLRITKVIRKYRYEMGWEPPKL